MSGYSAPWAQMPGEQSNSCRVNDHTPYLVTSDKKFRLLAVEPGDVMKEEVVMKMKWKLKIVTHRSAILYSVRAKMRRFKPKNGAVKQKLKRRGDLVTFDILTSDIRG